MKLCKYLLIALAFTPCFSSAAPLSRADFIGVTCSSADNGKTCWGFNETYGDGTMDSCGRAPNGGPEFAMKLVYEITENTKCETVVKTTHPRIMPVGTKFCAIYLERKPDGFTYRFDDDEPSKIRRIFNSTRAAKSCQSLIDSL
jgi:hypothetical protein